ncbi:hypothetical protein [Neobacillus sp. PS3-40]|uniref:hypothetical protein n=1 Tax=Neobacillus sp. PS3-40 TaxID=3070679 RepID=UPI0027DEF190|nr:hypothetical protein [Neobacillus sp. PS3-40]WML45706.1 hypothetical protein RCG20_07320 [Neobacillus sp. PS3-40]
MVEMLLKKLLYKEGIAAVLNPPEGYSLGIEAATVDLKGKYDFIQLFVTTSQEATDWLTRVIPMLNEDAIFWITYPKQSSKVKTDINRNILADMVQNETTFRVVSNVAVDDKWSALRIRAKDKVKTKK